MSAIEVLRQTLGREPISALELVDSLCRSSAELGFPSCPPGLDPPLWKHLLFPGYTYFSMGEVLDVDTQKVKVLYLPLYRSEYTAFVRDKEDFRSGSDRSTRFTKCILPPG